MIFFHLIHTNYSVRYRLISKLTLKIFIYFQVFKFIILKIKITSSDNYPCLPGRIPTMYVHSTVTLEAQLHGSRFSRVLDVVDAVDADDVVFVELGVDEELRRAPSGEYALD